MSKVEVLHFSSLEENNNHRQLVIDKIADLWREEGEWSLVNNSLLPYSLRSCKAPDIAAQYNDGHPLAIAEVTTGQGIVEEDNYVYWQKLGLIAPITFYLFVPKGYERVCYRLLKQHDVRTTLCTYGFDEDFEPIIEIA